MKKSLLTIVSSLGLLCGLGIVFPTLAVAQTTVDQYLPSGSIGIDVSSVNGLASIPTTASFGIVGVTDEKVYANNSYLAAEASQFTNLSFYVNTGLNTSSTSPYYQTALAEAGSGNVDQAAYDYGYNAGLAALAYAQSVGVNVNATWWLDVESTNTWNIDTGQNQQSLQGEHDALRAGGATVVGVYSTTAQWDSITGTWQSGWPSWGATTWQTATQALTYSTGHEFTGGPSYLMQYRPTGAVIDYDVACLTSTVVTSFTPSAGSTGSGVTVTGTGFTAASAVSFDGHPAASFTVRSATQIITHVPSAATSGAIAVTTPGGTATSTARFTIVAKPTLTLKLGGLASGALKLGKILTASGKVTPTNLGGKVTLTVQREQSGHWLAVTSVLRPLPTTGTCSWAYKPSRRATYRIKATIAKTSTHTAATTAWLAFTVK
ncbi:MAG: IPT/TIG domain-containing protein [Thermoleophilia bacterium]